jgi:hypothetical protein
LADCRRVVGGPRAGFRIINHELHSVIPLAASAGNLTAESNFSSRLNKEPSTHRRAAPSTGRDRRWLRHRRCPRPLAIPAVRTKDAVALGCGEITPGEAATIARVYETHCSRRPAFASLRIWHLYAQYRIASIAIARRSAAHDPSQIRRHCGSRHRSLLSRFEEADHPLALLKRLDQCVE